ncbi:M50 family metallopeptidase [Sandaracinus amylolyticus]|uniref:Intramembrane protease RasP/YluC, implicated in cell division based on FtsL cleavage n=1 Tax=Sandaracinus amylolyticus TaxID=927083 RepID=A0A0F6YHD8_9BACT|nr:M50 family metallopeptidase [Sandaracinus amylolyticus]AKF04966.1 Intramembrane protease RasP/YluC, implicated in cell division based on FtsL cleavage [Sandaracinus amylolyticus]
MNIVVAILGISFLVVVHETGHYLAARAFGMRVLRYSIGFGPPIFRYQPKGSPTVFQVCAIPFLAYVQIDGMNPAEEIDPNDPALFPNKGVLARMVTIFAGSFANYLAAMLIMFGFYLAFGMPRSVESQDAMIVGEVGPGTPAEQAGMQPGDRIVEANGRPITTIRELQAVTQPRAEQPTVYVVERDGQRLPPMTITPTRSPEDQGQIGVMTPLVFEPVSVGDAAYSALLWPLVQTRVQLEGMAALVRNRSTEGIQGPVGMTRMATESAERGPRTFIPFIALISVALGLFNLLPFPALDGGRLVFLGFELITRRRPNEKVEAVVHMVGLLFLLGVIVLVTFRDVMG